MDPFVVAGDSVSPVRLAAPERRLTHVVPDGPRLTLMPDLEQALRPLT